MSLLLIFILSVCQNIAHRMSSRSRNRDNMKYHAICAVFSNGIFFFTMHLLVRNDLDWIMAIPYISGTVVGSLVGARVSMSIEKAIGAKT